MPALKFITEKIFGPVKIYVSRPKLALSREIVFHLENLVGIKIVDHNEVADIILHLVGFEAGEYLETVSHTYELHSQLDKALSDKAKFILVKSKNYKVLGEAAVAMVSQFGRLFKLKYTIVEIDTKIPASIQAEEVIKKFIHSFKTQNLDIKPKNTPQPSEHKKQKLFDLLLVGFLILALLQLSFVLGVGKWQVNQYKTLEAVSQENLAEAMYQAKWGNFLGNILELNSIFAPVPKLVWEQKGGNFMHLKSVQKTISNYMEANTAYLNSWQNFWKEPEIVALEQVQNSLQSLLEKLNYLQAISQNPLLGDARGKLTKINTIFAEIPYLLGMKSQVKYLVLSQNNKNQVQAVQIIVVENGKIVSSRNMTAEYLDSQLKGEVLPPEDFVKATGISKWGIVYVNWDPDFNKVAAKAAWFISKQLNTGIDVVVGTHLEISDLEKVESNVINLGNFLLDNLESRQINIVNLHESNSQLGKTGWDGGMDLHSDFIYNKNTIDLPFNSWLDIQIKSDSLEHTFKSVYFDDKNYWRIVTPTKTISGQSKIAEVNYSLPFKTSNYFRYKLSVLNQPGFKNGKMRVNIKFDQSLKVISSQKAAVALPGELEYNTDLSRPFVIDLTFSK